MTVFATALTTLHRDPNMAVEASFRRPPYTWQTVRAILSQPTDQFGATRAGTLVAEILAGAVTVTPARGDELRIGATVHTVEDTERDVQGLSWKLTLSQPATDA